MPSLDDTDVNSNDESRATWFVHDRDGLRWDDPSDLATLRTTSLEQRISEHKAMIDQLIDETLEAAEIPLWLQHMIRRAADPTFGTGDTVHIRKAA